MNEKKITRIYLRTDKKLQPKIMEGIDEILVIISAPDEIDSSTSNNKTDETRVQNILSLLDDGVPVKAIADTVGVSPKTVYNYKKQRDAGSEQLTESVLQSRLQSSRKVRSLRDSGIAVAPV